MCIAMCGLVRVPVQIVDQRKAEFVGGLQLLLDLQKIIQN